MATSWERVQETIQINPPLDPIIAVVPPKNMATITV